MSNMNGTALASSADAANEVGPVVPPGGVAAWISGVEDTAPVDAVDRLGFISSSLTPDAGGTEWEPPTIAPTPTGNRRGWFRLRSEADRLEAELADAERLVPVQMHPVLLQRMSRRERAAAQRSARTVRTALRKEREASELAQVQRQVKDRRLETELADRAATDQRWHRRAESERARLTSPAARLADLFRSRRQQIRALMAVALVGVGWGAVNVHGILAHRFHLGLFNPGYWLAYGVEPLVTVPLIVLMTYQAKLAEWGRQTSWRDQRTIRLVELALLVAALGMNAAPHFNEGKAALIYAVPPMMIAVSMLMLPIIAAKLGEILIEARDDAAEQAALESEESALTKFTGRMLAVFEAAGKGEIGGERDAFGVPSATQIANHQGIGKGTAVKIRKLWAAARA